MTDTTIGRVRSLQPDIDDSYFDDGVEEVSDRQVWADLRIAISCWEPPRFLFSAFFLDEMEIKSVARQVASAVVVKTQKVSCEITYQQVPYDGSQLFDSPLPRDLSKLREASVTLDFPSEENKFARQLHVGQTLSVCQSCRGQKGIACPVCKGAGSRKCVTCGGSGMKRCLHCSGTGETLVSSTRTAMCDRCDGLGMMSCRACQSNGYSPCDGKGCVQGIVPCVSCNANGTIRKKPCLHIKSSAKVCSHLRCKDDWLPGNSQIATDLPLLRQQTFNGHADEVTPQMLRDVVPGALRTDAIRLGRTLASNTLPNAWDVGSRYELRAGYIYRVTLSHLNELSEVIVSGCSNGVTLLKPPARPKGFLRRMTLFLGTLFNWRQVRNSEHLKALKQGKAYLADLQLIGPALGGFDFTVSPNPDGYDVTWPQGPPGFNLAQLRFISPRGKNITLHCSVLIDDADRDAFVDALILSNRLRFGTIALQELNGRVIERFHLVYCQPYRDVVPDSLAVIIRQMMNDAAQIKAKNRLRLAPKKN